MPKIRKKLKTVGFSRNINNSDSTNYLFKSGILSSNEGKISKEDQLSFSFFPDEVIHNDTKNLTDDLFFHDSRTIIFNEKIVAPTMRLETKYVSDNALVHVSFYNENKLLKTPNVPNYYSSNSVNDTQLQTTRQASQTATSTPEIYNRMLKEKHLKSEDRHFSEKIDWSDKLEDKKYNKITIDYDLHKSPRPDLYLSFSKRQNTRQVTFPDNTSFYTFNGNTAYFYNNEYTDSNFGPFDYLGNVSRNYRFNISNFLNNSPICFNSISVSNNNIAFVQPQWGGVPIDTFGFPYNSKFDGAPRHLIPAAHYITKPFVIEKVCLEFKMSNWSFIDYDFVGNEMPCINFVNFFILNQRGKVNNNSLKSSREIKYYDTSSNSNSTETLNNILESNTTFYSTNNKSNNGTYTQQEIANMQFQAFPTQIKVDKIDGVDSHEGKDTKGQQRDLITTVSIANYSDPLNNGNYINKEKIQDIVDEFVDQSGAGKIGPNSQSECIYIDRNFKITSPVKHFYKNKQLTKFTSFNIYPEKPDSTRTNLDVKSGRSLVGENLNNTGSSSLVNDQFSNSTLINEFDFKESKYILNPEDSLILGVSLSNEFNTGEDTSGNAIHNFGEDLVKISCSEDYPLKLHLIGYYLEDENKKVIVNKTTKQFKNTKRIGYYQNEAVDQIGSNLGYLDQNFYDRDVIARQGETITKEINSSKNKTRLGNKFEIPNLNPSEYSDVGFTSLSLYYNGLSFKKDYYKLLESSSAVYVLKHYYNKYRFGMFLDKLNHNRIHQFIDSKYKNVKKRFMKGFYKQKTPGTVSAKLKFDFSKINEFKGTNYLVSEIMSGTDIKSSADYQLSFVIRDNLSQEVKLVYSNLILGQPTSDTHESEYYDLENNIYTCINTTLKDKFNLTNGIYSSSEINKAKREFLQKIAAGINEINSKNQTDGSGLNPKDFKIGVTASIVESSMSTDFPEIKITLNAKGSLNDAKIIFDDINSGVIIEDFALEEGDLLNSYNTTSNALYSNSDIMFKDR